MNRPGKVSAKAYRSVTLAIGAVFLGTALTSITTRPPVAMVGVTLMAAVAGATALSLRGGLIRGAFIGLLGAAAIVFALNQMRTQSIYRAGPPAITQPAASQPTTTSQPASGPAWEFRRQWVVADREMTAIGGTTVLMSLAAAGGLAWAAKRRRDLVG